MIVGMTIEDFVGHSDDHFVGCNNGGGGGNFSKSKAVSSKAHRSTETVIFLGFKFFALRESDFRNARTFSQDLFYPSNLVCTFVSVHGLLKYPRKFGFSRTAF